MVSTKMRYVLMILSVVMLVVIGIVSIKFLGADNPVEELAEEMIKDETGITVDLSPSTAEVAK